MFNWFLVWISYDDRQYDCICLSTCVLPFCTPFHPPLTFGQPVYKGILAKYVVRISVWRSVLLTTIPIQPTTHPSLGALQPCYPCYPSPTKYLNTTQHHWLLCNVTPWTPTTYPNLLYYNQHGYRNRSDWRLRHSYYPRLDVIIL